ncbi:Uncharacterised protein [Vibrio cholerae]|nr:Uncharacterised protein [Vibrio cholerae]CSI14904.1 Uncharacterised protein [Vibrio cholerae]
MGSGSITKSSGWRIFGSMESDSRCNSEKASPPSKSVVR